MTPLNSKPIDHKIQDADGNTKTIRIDSFLVGSLQKHLPDFQSWIETAYLEASRNHPSSSSRAIGDLVRKPAEQEAKKSPLYQEAYKKLLEQLD